MTIRREGGRGEVGRSWGCLRGYNCSTHLLVVSCWQSLQRNCQICLIYAVDTLISPINCPWSMFHHHSCSTTQPIHKLSCFFVEESVLENPLFLNRTHLASVDSNSNVLLLPVDKGLPARSQLSICLMLIRPLMQAHTCENILELPNYWESLLQVNHIDDPETLSGEVLMAMESRTAEILQERLAYAIAHCIGYSLDEMHAAVRPVPMLIAQHLFWPNHQH